MGAREKLDILMYEGNLDVEDLLDWFRDLDKYLTMRMSKKTRKLSMLSLD
jgi:hypothetical protein